MIICLPGHWLIVHPDAFVHVNRIGAQHNAVIEPAPAHNIFAAQHIFSFNAAGLAYAEGGSGFDQIAVFKSRNVPPQKFHYFGDLLALTYFGGGHDFGVKRVDTLVNLRHVDIPASVGIFKNAQLLRAARELARTLSALYFVHEKPLAHFGMCVHVGVQYSPVHACYREKHGRRLNVPVLIAAEGCCACLMSEGGIAGGVDKFGCRNFIYSGFG